MPRNRGQKQKGTSVRKGKNNQTCTEVIDYLNPEEKKRNMLDLEQYFYLTFLAGLVKKCYRCGQLFTDKLRKPPNDLLLKRYDYRKYPSPNSMSPRV